MQPNPFRAGEKPGTYVMESTIVTENAIFSMAKQLAKSHLKKRKRLGHPSQVKMYLQSLMHDLERETFAVLFVDTRYRVISFEHVFYGTLNASMVYPREVIKLALERNAAAVVLTHNHPSGDSTPSSADIQVTQRLKSALALVDIHVLDHIVVGRDGSYSFAEHGQM